MIKIDGRPTITTAVGRLEDLPVELLSDRERRERAENEIVEQVLGVSCTFCGSGAAEFDGDDQLGCPDCGYDAPESQVADEAPDPAEQAAERADPICPRCGREVIAGIPSPCPVCGDDPGPMNAQQLTYDRRERRSALLDRVRMANA